MSVTQRLLLLLIVVSSSLSLAGVTRVGNQSIGSEEEGFETTLPQYYPKTESQPGYLVLSAPGSGGLVRKTDLFAYTVRSFLPEWSEKTREQWKTDIENMSRYVDFIEIEDSCVLAARWVNSKDQVFGVATWGEGKGVIFSGEGSSITWRGTEHLLENIQLKPGACAWN